MANGRVLGSLPFTPKRRPDIAECPRCGVERSVHGGANRTGLCKDCSRGMTPEEREKWK